MNTPSQPKTLEEIVIDLLTTQLEGQGTLLYFATEALTEIQALIEREVINIDEEVPKYGVDVFSATNNMATIKSIDTRNKLRATQRQNLSKLIRGEE